MAEVKRLQVIGGVTITAPTTLAFSKMVPVTWAGSDSPKTVDVSAYVPDATKVAWTLCKGSGSNYLQIGAELTAPSISTVVITVGMDLDAGQYYLKGVY